MDKVTLTRVYTTTKKRDGTPFKFGSVKIAIKTQEHGDVWLSKFAKEGDACLNWKEGDKVIIKVWLEGQYWNFDVPDRVDHLEERVARLETLLKGSTRPDTMPASTRDFTVDSTPV